MKTPIRNGQIITAVDNYHADILIEDQLVSAIGASLNMEADQVIDAAGKLVIPGGIDPHHPHGAAVRRHCRPDDFRPQHHRRSAWRHNHESLTSQFKPKANR